MKSSEDLNDDELALILDLAEVFRFWLNAIEAEGTRRLLSGHPIRGRKLVLTRKNRRFTNVKAVKDRLEKIGIPEDEYNPRRFGTPAQVEKVLKRHRVFSEWGSIAKFVEHPAGTPVMVGEHDPRNEYFPGSEFDPIG